MWQIKRVEANNFLSFNEVIYNIVNNKLTMVYGQNNDISKNKSNGSGKSSLLDIISFGICGDSLRKVKSIKELIRNNTEDCFVEIDLENKVLKKTLTIRRSLTLKSSQKIFVILNGETQKQLYDLHPRESDAFIEEQLGISFNDLINYYLISKFRYQSLFLANDTAKKEVINRFSKADIIENVFSYIDDDSSKLVSSFEKLGKEFVESETKIKLYDEQIELIKNEIDDEHINYKVENVEEKIKNCKNEIQKFENSNHNLILDIKLKNERIVELNLKIINEEKIKKIINNSLELNKKLQLKRDEYRNVRIKYKSKFDDFSKEEIEVKHRVKNLEEEIKEYDKFIKELESYLAGEIECPKCKHHFILADKEFNIQETKDKILPEFQQSKLDSETQLKEEKEDLERIKILVEGLENQIVIDQNLLQKEAETIKENFTKVDNEILKLRKDNSDINLAIIEYNNEIQAISSEINSQEKQIIQLNNNIKIYKEEIEQLKSNETEQLKIKEIKLKIKSELIKNKDFKQQIELLEQQRSKLEEWKNKFKRFKSFLANQSLVQIQDQANYFLHKMKSDLTVSIDGFRELKSGKIKEEINVELSRDGLNSESFGKFSGGEKSLSDLSAILSMQKIINLTSQSGGLNFLAIDEVMESVDNEGMNNITKCLNDLSQTILLVAHSIPNENIDCNLLKVEKKNGISKII